MGTNRVQERSLPPGSRHSATRWDIAGVAVLLPYAEKVNEANGLSSAHVRSSA